MPLSILALGLRAGGGRYGRISRFLAFLAFVAFIARVRIHCITTPHATRATNRALLTSSAKIERDTRWTDFGESGGFRSQECPVLGYPEGTGVAVSGRRRRRNEPSHQTRRYPSGPRRRPGLRAARPSAQYRSYYYSTSATTYTPMPFGGEPASPTPIVVYASGAGTPVNFWHRAVRLLPTQLSLVIGRTSVPLQCRRCRSTSARLLHAAVQQSAELQLYAGLLLADVFHADNALLLPPMSRRPRDQIGSDPLARRVSA